MTPRRLTEQGQGQKQQSSDIDTLRLGAEGFNKMLLQKKEQLERGNAGELQ